MVLFLLDVMLVFLDRTKAMPIAGWVGEECFMARQVFSLWVWTAFDRKCKWQGGGGLSMLLVFSWQVISKGSLLFWHAACGRVFEKQMPKFFFSSAAVLWQTLEEKCQSVFVVCSYCWLCWQMTENEGRADVKQKPSFLLQVFFDRKMAKWGQGSSMPFCCSMVRCI